MSFPTTQPDPAAGRDPERGETATAQIGIHEALARHLKCGFSPMIFEYVLCLDESALRFAIENAPKDMTILAAFAQTSGAADPIEAAMRNRFATAVPTGHREKSFAALSEVVAEPNGVSLAEAARHGGGP